MFVKATKKSARLRMALMGPAGSGKTYTALRVGCALGDKVALIDTERGSASKYADRFGFDSVQFDAFSPQAYVDAIETAGSIGYDVLIIDSLSHAWTGKDGALEQVDKAVKRSKSGNSFAAWRDVTPLHNALIDSILASRCHVIATMRTKTEYVMEDSRGKKIPKKVGMAPIQRDGVEYEFDVVADLDHEGNFVVTKTRCPELSGMVVKHAGEEVAGQLRDWLTDGAGLPEQPLADEETINKLNAQLDIHEPDLGRVVSDKVRAKLVLGSLTTDKASEIEKWISVKKGW